MRANAVAINWTKKPLGEEQRILCHYAAAYYLCNGGEGKAFYLQHALCEGRITKKREGTYGMYAGTFFEVDLGAIDGSPWLYEFLLLRGAEAQMMHEGDGADLVFAPNPGGGGSLRIVERSWKPSDIKLGSVHSLH